MVGNAGSETSPGATETAVSTESCVFNPGLSTLAAPATDSAGLTESSASNSVLSALAESATEAAVSSSASSPELVTLAESATSWRRLAFLEGVMSVALVDSVLAESDVWDAELALLILLIFDLIFSLRPIPKQDIIWLFASRLLTPLSAATVY